MDVVQECQRNLLFMFKSFESIGSLSRVRRIPLRTCRNPLDPVDGQAYVRRNVKIFEVRNVPICVIFTP